MKATSFLSASILWLVMIALSYYYQVDDDKEYGYKIAYKQAELFFDHVVLMQHWNANFSGVYVRLEETGAPADTEPKRPSKELTTSDGRTLTLIDPSLMVRQLAKMEEQQSGIRFHIASLTPQTSEHKADEWETKALVELGKGTARYQGVGNIGDKSYFRFMGPLVFDATCTVCHNEPDIKVGDRHGGISVSIPSASIDDFVSDRLVRLQRSHLLIAAIGLIALLFANWAQTKLTNRLTKAKSHLQLAYLDALTLLPNRRYYDAFVRREWKRASRHHYPLSVIMIDIDFFKAYNDSLGHLEGDDCLRQVARTLRRYFRRSGDLIARYGGEEFCVVAACDLVQSMQLAEILRMAVENIKLPHPSSNVSQYVTISLGVATMIPKENLEFGDLLLHADKALYEAKHSGRNRVAKFSGHEDE